MKMTCPECLEETAEDDWDPEEGMCLECANHFQNEDALHEEEFEASIEDARPTDFEVEEDDGDIN